MRRKPSAFTLLEILLVVAILVAFAAITAPVYRNVTETHKLRKSAEILRAELAKTRLKAMNSGRVQMFRYQINQRGFTTQPWYAEDDLLEANAEDTLRYGGQVAAMAANDDAKRKLEELPEGVVFLGSEIRADLRAGQIQEAMQQELATETTWSPPIIFYPDGSSSNARIVLGNRQQMGIQVMLRGLTGLTDASDISAVENFVQAGFAQ